jgi:hypothetical protein
MRETNFVPTVSIRLRETDPATTEGKMQGRAKVNKSHEKYFVIVSRFDGEKDNEAITSAFKILATKT